MKSDLSLSPEISPWAMAAHSTPSTFSLYRSLSLSKNCITMDIMYHKDTSVTLYQFSCDRIVKPQLEIVRICFGLRLLNLVSLFFLGHRAMIPSSTENSGQLKRAAIDATAGLVAGGISRTVTSPLDVIKIRFQVQIFFLYAFFWLLIRLYLLG